MPKLTASASSNLDAQGFGGLDQQAKARQAWSLRFTPAVAVTLVVIGLILQSPIWLAAMSLIALTGALWPDGMLIDLLYNHIVRHLLHTAPLPPTPTPRRFSYLLSTVLLAGSAISFQAGLTVLGGILAAMVIIGGALLTTTLWCLGSWIYRTLFPRAAA
ncbi:hypothetical protein ABIB25_005445 [Nakamurella sp. UYEF19]|uniref:DUF4395 family protein n=1 Tax=Nakamurella sp. UYEF19 TaxID=1756392 RepID=UPI0033980B58